jgi:hypothetical protein
LDFWEKRIYFKNVRIKFWLISVTNKSSSSTKQPFLGYSLP